MIEPKLRHDFLNNCLRIEVLNRLLSETIEKNLNPQKEHMEDLYSFLNDHVVYLDRINERIK